MMQFNFPRTIFVDKNGVVGQTFHIETEVEEMKEALQQPDIMLDAMETMDAYHSCETKLRILQEKHLVDLDALQVACEAKNRTRGYYS